jgi:hypothetical protein
MVRAGESRPYVRSPAGRLKPAPTYALVPGPAKAGLYVRSRAGG